MIAPPWSALVRMLTYSSPTYTGGHAPSCKELRKKILIDSQIENASHDSDKIEQAECKHGKEKALNIDVDKMLGLKGDCGVVYD